MRSIRLLPIVVMAASALLALKMVGLLTGDGYTLSGVSAVVAQDAPAASDAGYTPEQLMAAEAAATSLFSSTPSSSEPQDELTLLAIDATGTQSPVLSQAGETERVLLERLAERRAELDALAAQLETRMAVVEAAEMRIEERMAELSAVEARINAMIDAREAAHEAQFAGIVAMYEAMRPADAATIFNDLDRGILTQVGRAMNPRKLGPILAKMEPSKAQELTVLLARAESEPEPAAVADGFGHLPQIVGQ